MVEMGNVQVTTLVNTSDTQYATCHCFKYDKSVQCVLLVKSQVGSHPHCNRTLTKKH